MSQTGGNLNEDEGIYANQNETVDEDIYTNPETIRAQTDGIDRKQQGGKLPGKYFFLKMKHCAVMVLITTYTLFLELGLIFSKLYEPFLKSKF